jgi:anti-anti-sigma factor
MSEPHYRHISCRTDGDVLILTVKESHLQTDDLADGVRKEMAQAVEHYQLNKLVLDFQEVRYFGSAGFRPLLSMVRKLRDLNGRMIFCNLCLAVQEIFQITRLIHTNRSTLAPFETAPTLAEALAQLRQPVQA